MDPAALLPRSRRLPRLQCLCPLTNGRTASPSAGDVASGALVVKIHERVTILIE
jgi:hypothetical protein